MLQGQPLNMILFASFDSVSQALELNQEALRRFEEFSLGQIYIVCNEGFSNKEFTLHRGYSRIKKNKENIGNSIWMRPEPVYDPHISKYIFFMDIESTDPEVIGVLHMFASLISYVIIAVTEQVDPIAHFGYTANHIKETSRSKNSFNLKVKNNNANLICLIPREAQGLEFQDSTQMLLNKLAIEGVEDETLKVHPTVKGYEVAWSSIKNSSRTLEDSLITEVQYMLKGDKGNSEFMYGHIFVQYVLYICKKINQTGMVEVTGIEDQIQIDGAYEAYLAGVKKHSDHSLMRLKNIEHPDGNLLIEVLEESKKKALEEYFNLGGAKNLKYRDYLDNYTDNVNQRTIENYSISQRNKNLQILQSQSKYVLDRIQRDNLTEKKNSNQLIQRQIDIMKNTYEAQARGPEKHSIYNDYMKIFLPVVFSGDKKKQEELRRSIRKNQLLRRKRDELKKKKGGCCSSCSLM